MLLHSESAAEKHCTHKPLARDSIRSVKPCAYGERLSFPVSVRYVTSHVEVTTEVTTEEDGTLKVPARVCL